MARTGFDFGMGLIFLTQMPTALYDNLTKAQFMENSDITCAHFIMVVL